MPLDNAKGKRTQAIVALILMTLLVAVVSKGASRRRSADA